MQIISTIILDLGGVIINLDYHRTAKAFQNLGIADFEAIYSQKKQDNLFNDFEKGLIFDDTFRNEIRKYLSPTTTDNQIDAAWNAMLLDIPSHRMELLQNLKSRYRIFLLSNTNSIHVNSISAMLAETYGSATFESIFEKVYYSCRINMRKPDSEIFEKVLTENNLDRETTIFIDDSMQHIQGAANYGLTAHLLEKDMELSKLLTLLGLI